MMITRELLRFIVSPLRYFGSGRFKLLIVSCLLLAVSAFSQSDSIVIRHTHWNNRKVAPGIRLKQSWFNGNLFGSTQNITILEVKVNRHNRIDLAAEPKELKPTSQIATEHGATAAINGTFFNMKDGGSVDYIRSNGDEISPTAIRNAAGKRAVHQRSALVIDPRQCRIVAWDGSPDWEARLPGEDVMVTGPLLLQNGRIMPLDSISGFFARHPRSAVALRGSRVYFITVDGRNDKAAGMTLRELAHVLQWMGFTDAINLDGGGSTTLWLKDFPYGGVVNHPSDNKIWERSKAYQPGMDLDNLPADTSRWDHTGERKVANVLLVVRH